MPNDQYPDKKEMTRRRQADPVFSDPAKPSEIDSLVLPAGGLRTVRPERKATAQVERLARRLGKDPEALASEIPEETLRKTRWPVLEQVIEGGKRIFKHDLGIASSGVQSLTQSDHAREGTPRQSAPRERDSSGKFI